MSNVNVNTLLKRLAPAVGILLAAALLAGCGSNDMSRDSLTQIIRSGARPMQAEAKSDDYVIRLSDHIKLEVWGYPEFNTEQVVKEIGTVSIPNVGEVAAAGFTKDQFRQQLVTKLAEYIQGEVKISLTVISAVPQKITVIGAVTRQENYPLTTEVTLLEAISMAGGTTVESDLRAVRILRGGLSAQPIEVDLEYYMEVGSLESVPIIRPGDVIYVPRNENVIRELSMFMRDVIFVFGFFELFN
jgi:polysaccharide export outer membrane protein